MPSEWKVDRVMRAAVRLPEAIGAHLCVRRDLKKTLFGLREMRKRSPAAPGVDGHDMTVAEPWRGDERLEFDEGRG